MTLRQRTAAWLVAVASFVLLVYLLRDVLLPFVAGMAVAYLLDPACDWLERRGCSRTLATVIITVAFFLMCLVLLAVFVPFVVGQLLDFARRLPIYVAELRDLIVVLLAEAERRLGAEQILELRNALGAYTPDLLRAVAGTAGRIAGGVDTVFGAVSVIFLTPLVAFYLLRDWDRLIARVDGWLPRAQAETIREQVREIDRTLAGFVRGQGTVCLILGLFYGIALAVVGLDFGFLIGLATGLLSFVPFLGMLVGFAVGVGVAIVQFGEWVPVLTVVGIFLIGQFVEGNLLTPKLVGDRVGLHPVWVIFGVLAGGALFGFVGVLLAIPLMAAMGVLARFALARYLASPLYRDATTESVDDAAS